MNHIFRISDEEYAKLVAYAALHKQTPEKLFQEWIRGVTHNVEPTISSKQVKSPDQEKQEESEKEFLNNPLFQVAGIFAIGEPGWADK